MSSDATWQRSCTPEVRKGQSGQWTDMAGKMDRSLYVIQPGECVLMRDGKGKSDNKKLSIKILTNLYKAT